MIIFKKPKNELEGQQKVKKVPRPTIPDDMCVRCSACGKTLFNGDLIENLYVCTSCGHHFRMGARARVGIISDPGSFTETDASLSSKNIISFLGYNQKLAKAAADSGEKECVVTGFCTVCGFECGIFAMEPHFMMGSMGSVIGEKLTSLFEKAAERSLPVVGFTVSGGARMQEGIISLMQMAKVSAAVKKHSDAGNLYLAVLTDPTMGGVSASFAFLGDIIIAEPKALIGFAGPRVIEQTIHQKLPENFQRAEFLLEKGFIDSIVERRKQREYITKILRLHTPT